MAAAGAFEYTYRAFPPWLYRRFLDLYVKPYQARAESILDLGCGSGGLIQELKGDYDGVILGIDVGQASIDACRARPSLAEPRITFARQDVSALAGRPEYQGRFDLVVSYSVLHFVPGDTPSKLRLLAGITRLGAVVAVDALARVSWNRFLFGVVKALIRTGLWRFALRVLGAWIGPSFPPEFLEELGRMEYLRYLRYRDFLELDALDSPETARQWDRLRLDVVPQDGFLTGRKARLTLRRR